MALVQKFIVEPPEEASPIMPQHVALFTPDGEPLAIDADADERVAKNPGAKATAADIVAALVEAGLMEPADGDE